MKKGIQNKVILSFVLILFMASSALSHWKVFHNTSSLSKSCSIEAETGGDDKPAIYIYPEKEMNIHVSIDIDGKLTKTIPEYKKDGWHVRVKPSGAMKVIGGNSQITYDYLFYEDIHYFVQRSEEGWVVKKEDIKVFFENILPKLGLIEKESKEFIDYWVPKLSTMKKEYIRIHLLNEDFFKKHWKLNIEPKPDRILRLEFYFEGIEKEVKINEPKIKKFERKGYYAVEWGGTMK